MAITHASQQAPAPIPSPPDTVAPVAPGSHPAAWLVASALLFFLVPWVGADRLGLQPDLYYLCYFTVAIAFFAVFAVHYTDALRPLWRNGWWSSLVVGAATGAALLGVIFRQEGNPHPDGWRYAFELVWRGVVYGSVDALTLYVLPAAVAYLLLRGNRRGWRRKAGFAGLALLCSLVVTTTYHLGYADYRGRDLRFPELGAVAGNVATAVTGNPIGGVVTHATMHVGAVVHERDGGDARMLPPLVTPDSPGHGSSDLAAGLASAWLLVAAGAVFVIGRRGRRARVGRQT